MAILFVFIGLSLVVVGFLIWKLRMVGIIAGYDEGTTKDKAGLARWLGMNLILMGVVVSLLSAGYLLRPEVHPLLFLAVAMAVILVVAVRAIKGTGRFEE